MPESESSTGSLPGFPFRYIMRAAVMHLPPAENRSGGDINEAYEDEGTWVIAAFEVPENWRSHE